MLYLIGLGLNEKGISLEGKEIVSKCSKAYLEGYTVDFPYTLEQLSEVLGKEIIKLVRGDVESDRLINEARNEDVALLISGSPLFATTHETLINDARKAKVNLKVIYSASIFDGIASSGLQLYKFGKITSMPKWQKSFTPNSFMDIVRENQSIKAHSLILTDIGLDLPSALNQLLIASEVKNISLGKILVCANVGTKEEKFFYDSLENLSNKEIKLPFCLIIPSDLHFVEKEALESL